MPFHAGLHYTVSERGAAPTVVLLHGLGSSSSDWPEQHHSFSDPAAGIVAGNSIAFPLNQGCATGIEFTSTVKAWIYDSDGNRSKPVIIHLACTT